MKILLTLTGGGYLYEALALAEKIADCGTFCYVTGEDCAVPSDYVGKEVYFMPNITSISESGKVQIAGKLLRAIFAGFRVVRMCRPDAIIAVGTSLSVPLAIAARLRGIRFVYIESITRVTKPSTTGRILSIGRLADRIYVQWPESEGLFRGSVYRGTVL